MRKLIFFLSIFGILLTGLAAGAQELRFNQVLKSSIGNVERMLQDKHGVIWLAVFGQGVYRYDGVNLRLLANEYGNANSLTPGPVIAICSDKDNMLWIGSLGGGLDKFDPSTNSFTHFKHNPKDPFSLSADTVGHVLEDRAGNLWVGTSNGVDVLDRKTGRFRHYRHDPLNPESLTHPVVFRMYEDKKGIIWIYTAVPLPDGLAKQGALHRLDQATGKFTRYLQDPDNPASIIPGSLIDEIYEDKNNNFWLGTNAGLYMLDRASGKCTRYYVNPFQSSKLSPTPVSEKFNQDVSFITEDSSGAFWVGMWDAGMVRYDPVTKMSTHYGVIRHGNKVVSMKDTTSGFESNLTRCSMSTRDGIFWVGGTRLFNMDMRNTTLPFYDIGRGANAFYREPNSKILWIATDKGLVRRDEVAKTEKAWVYQPIKKDGILSNQISTMLMDEKGIIWLGTDSGLNRFDPGTERFDQYRHNAADPSSIAGGRIRYLFLDHAKNLWAAGAGLSRMDRQTGKFTKFNIEKEDSASPYVGNLLCIVEDKQNDFWISSGNGVIRMKASTGTLTRYLRNSYIKSICVDAAGTIWAGGVDGLYFLDNNGKDFTLFANRQSTVPIADVINIIEDDDKSLWVSTTNAIIKIDDGRQNVRKFSGTNGVRLTNFFYNHNHKAADGRLYLGIEDGYYAFYPKQIQAQVVPPILHISAFRLGDKEWDKVAPGLLTSPIWDTKELRLSHDQNVFSFDFTSIDYITPGDEKHLFMLENYDNTWHDIGGNHRASFFNVPPGEYTFRVKAVSSDGATAEKSIRILISPPWYKTWWAYTLYALLFAIGGYLVFLYQKHYILKREREKTQQKELAQAKEIEKAYHELKSTQAQLIQAEKMASLGQLTAGIAHEIQNPLNFINNFAEINQELIAEIEEAIAQGDQASIAAIAADIKANEQKIQHHGKRADGIVKGMLQHSRNNSGQKEWTDLNALCDEYLRLAYHGLRAKDKSFNAKFESDFDNSLEKINVVPQDIGRVVLNLINNAFYAVNERKKTDLRGYVPEVRVSTKDAGREVLICVQDNGTGIPQKVIDKIFQPFFTTKPAGQGTGLGLSMSYDIITKGHHGQMQVEAEEGKGTRFIITIPKEQS